MSLEAAVKELNENIVKLIGVLEVYPSTLDEKTGVAEAPKKDTPAPEAEKETAEPSHTMDEIKALASQLLKADKEKNRAKIKEKVDDLGVAKISKTPADRIDEVYEYLEGLK